MFPLGVLGDGEQFNFFLIGDGANLNDPSLFENGTLRFKDANGGTLNRSDFGGTVLEHVAPDGTVTEIEGDIFFGADDSEGTPNNNRLNPDGLGHLISGFDPETGDTLLAFEDDAGRPPDSDRDFNDVIIRVNFGSLDNTESLIPLGAPEGFLDATIVDPDSDLFSEASIRISDGVQTGDKLVLTGFADSDGDGKLDGTNIEFTQVSDTEIALSGDDTNENYTAVINGIRYQNTINPSVGDRTVEVIVTDAEGNASDPAISTLSIQDNRIPGTDASETIEGDDQGNAIAGGKGDDELLGLGNNDVLDGGPGDDDLDGGEGSDILNGGQGNDDLLGGPGADTFRFNSLREGRDTIFDFDATEGDRLDLTNIFDSNFDPNDPSAREFIIFQAVDDDLGGVANDINVLVDLDGPGSNHVPVPVATLDNPTGINPDSAITDVTTFPAVRMSDPDPVPTAALPDIEAGQRVPDNEVNNVDQNVLVGDGSTEITITFVSEQAGFDNAFGIYKLDDAGNVSDVEILFGNLNEAAPGTTESLGVLPAGQKFNMFLIGDGFDLNDPALFTSGTFEFQNAAGNPLNINDPGVPKLIHTAANGTQTEIAGDIFFGADGNPATPNSNSLNPDGVAHFISGADPDTGNLLVAIEDVALNDTPPSDRDFNDALIRVNVPADGQSTVSATAAVDNVGDPGPDLTSLVASSAPELAVV